MEESLSFERIKKGSIVKGEIISLSKDEVVVNINYFCDGIIIKNELLLDDIDKCYEKGREISVYVVSLDDGKGNVELSERRAYRIETINELKDFYKSGKILNVFVKQELNSGFVCEFKGVSGFIPKSKVLMNRYGVNKFLGKSIDVTLIELDISRNRFIFSHKDAEEIRSREEREKFIDRANIGDKFLGTVESIKDFGIFVKVEGISGFVHKSEMSHKLKFNINDMVKVDDRIDVYVLKIDKDNQKVYFTMKDLNYDPFLKYKDDFEIGSVYEVYVEKIMSSGMIVSLNHELTGFIHISEFPEEVKNLNKEFKIGDKVRAKVLKMDEDNKKISLSYEKIFEEIFNDEYVEEEKFNTFGDIFKDFFSKLK